MKRYISILALTMMPAVFSSCGSDDSAPPPTQIATPPVIQDPDPAEDVFIRSADVSYLPEIESSGTLLMNGTSPEDMITTLKNAGCNAIRMRLWKNPASGHSNLAEVQALAQRVKNVGLKVWLTVHYSDTWADPGNQAVPAEWQSLDFPGLKAAVSEYTSEILAAVHPDIFQIGNETNDGFLWPMGKMSVNESLSVQLFAAASTVIRNESPQTKIMIHFAGLSNSSWFFGKVSPVDYDYIGLSYYPIWHGYDMAAVNSTISTLGATYGKKIVIAETAYPFTLGWADWTNNIVGLESQLIPGYPATADGQKSFVTAIKAMMKASPYGMGFSYWGGEWISFHGAQATNGSTFENQALYDFDHKALPAMEAFSE